MEYIFIFALWSNGSKDAFNLYSEKFFSDRKTCERIGHEMVTRWRDGIMVFALHRSAHVLEVRHNSQTKAHPKSTASLHGVRPLSSRGAGLDHLAQPRTRARGVRTAGLCNDASCGEKVDDCTPMRLNRILKSFQVNPASSVAGNPRVLIATIKRARFSA